MVVQAQPSSIPFVPDFSFGQPGIVMMKSHHHQIGNPISSYGKADFIGDPGMQATGLPNASTVLSDINPQSELTCNVSGSRKRSREDQLSTSAALMNVVLSPIHVPDSSLVPAPFALKNGFHGAATSALPPLFGDPSLRVFDSASASTSGRQTNAAVQTASIPLGQEILAQICHHNFEMDALIRFQNERIRLAMEEVRKRHCKSLISFLEHRVVKRLQDKEAELEAAFRKNAELEDKIRQISADNQIWFNLARNNEALVSNLRTNLEQVLLQSSAPAVHPLFAEGYGDSDGTPFAIDDAQSFCVDEEACKAGVDFPSNPANLQRMNCKVCGIHDACVLILPCRHLCLCKDCETSISVCPICNYPKNACLRVFMS